MSDDGGRTFNEWINLLGGKSVNGNAVMFQYKDSVPYHIYWQVLNAKNYGVPQNRERVFIIGIRDDVDNAFTFPPEEFLSKRLKDVLEEQVDNKYFLSEKMVDVLSHHKNPIIDNQTPKKSATIHAGYFKMGGRDQQYIKVTNFQGNDICNTIRTGGKGSLNDKHNWDIIKVKSATSKGYEEATDGDSINIAFSNSETRRGRVGNGVAQTLDTACNQAVVMQLNPSKESGGKQPYQQNRVYDINGINPALNAGQETWGGNAIINTNYQIRRLTPRECFRLMDFPDTFDFSVVSDSQAYKQAGNSIVVNVLYKIIKNLNL